MDSALLSRIQVGLPDPHGSMKMKKMLVALPLVALVAACGGSGGDGAASRLKVVGSSTVYPFTTAVAEEFQRANPGSSVIVESTGTGAGIKLFCGGIGEQFPDMVNASRPMKASEYADCAKAGAKKSSKCRSASTASPSSSRRTSRR